MEGYRNLVLSHSVTKGIKQVDFHVRYTYGGVRTEETISVYVNVTKGASTGGGGGVTFHSQPKLIVEKYALSTEKLYAGEPFDLTLSLRNTSADEAIKNIQLRMVDETGTVLPAENGSNTLYIKEMEKEGASTVKVTLQAAPDAEAKAYAMALSFSYDGVSSKQAYTTEESITLPIQQRIRIKCDEPLVYDEPWVGQTAAVGVSLYNMGKSSIYNCMVTVEGEGLSMPETYFGGNIASGGTMRAEFDVQTDVAGDIAGEVVISYEDVYGEQMQERLPLQMFVNEQIAIDPVLEDGAMAGGMEDSYADPAMGYADDGMSGGMGGAEGREASPGTGGRWQLPRCPRAVVVLGIPAAPAAQEGAGGVMRFGDLVSDRVSEPVAPEIAGISHGVGHDDRRGVDRGHGIARHWHPRGDRPELCRTGSLTLIQVNSWSYVETGRRFGYQPRDGTEQEERRGVPADRRRARRHADGRGLGHAQERPVRFGCVDPRRGRVGRGGVRSDAGRGAVPRCQARQHEGNGRRQLCAAVVPRPEHRQGGRRPGRQPQGGTGRPLPADV